MTGLAYAHANYGPVMDGREKTLPSCMLRVGGAQDSSER